MDALFAKVRPSSFGQRRNYSTIDISAEKWLMHYDAASLAKLESPPSLADGISRELERDIRYLGCELIQSGAILLRLSQTAAATAQILFQRYYYLKSFVRYNFEHMVQASLLLASKIEEEPRKPRDVLNVYNRLKQIHLRRCAEPTEQNEAVQKLSKKWFKNLVNTTQSVVLSHHLNGVDEKEVKCNPAAIFLAEGGVMVNLKQQQTSHELLHHHYFLPYQQKVPLLMLTVRTLRHRTARLHDICGPDICGFVAPDRKCPARKCLHRHGAMKSNFYESVTFWCPSLSSCGLYGKSGGEADDCVRLLLCCLANIGGTHFCCNVQTHTPQEMESKNEKLLSMFEHLELSSKKYQELKNIVIKAERRLLNVLGFVVHVHHPHKLIYIYLHILGQLKNDPKKHTANEIRKSRQLLQKAWSFMNDGLRTDMFLRYTPETIACACIQLAVRTVEDTVVLPSEPFAWFELFDASDRDVRAISQTIWELYTRTKAPNLKWISEHLEQLYQQTVVEPQRVRKEKTIVEIRDIKAQILQRRSAAQEIAQQKVSSPAAGADPSVGYKKRRKGDELRPQQQRSHSDTKRARHQQHTTAAASSSLSTHHSKGQKSRHFRH